MQVICFDTLKKGTWFRTVCDTFSKRRQVQECQIYISDDIAMERIMPVHLVTLAYLIDAMKKEGAKVSIVLNTVGSFIYNDLHFKDYFSEGSPTYISVQDERILGLWRVNDVEKEVHPKRVQDYLKRVFFHNKDLSAVGTSLLEAYYNIFDHSGSTNNAWSMMKYDEQMEKLSVAVCDCGIGIPESVRQYIRIPNLLDEDALTKALEDKFTTKSKTHNGGMGLGTIKGSCIGEDYLRIFSGQGLLIANRDKVRIEPTPFHFQGTLLYYDLSLKHFEEDTIEDFTF